MVISTESSIERDLSFINNTIDMRVGKKSAFEVNIIWHEPRTAWYGL